MSNDLKHESDQEFSFEGLTYIGQDPDRPDHYLLQGPDEVTFVLQILPRYNSAGSPAQAKLLTRDVYVRIVGGKPVLFSEHRLDVARLLINDSVNLPSNPRKRVEEILRRMQALAVDTPLTFTRGDVEGMMRLVQHVADFYQLDIYPTTRLPDSKERSKSTSLAASGGVQAVKEEVFRHAQIMTDEIVAYFDPQGSSCQFDGKWLHSREPIQLNVVEPRKDLSAHNRLTIIEELVAFADKAIANAASDTSKKNLSRFPKFLGIE